MEAASRRSRRLVETRELTSEMERLEEKKFGELALPDVERAAAVAEPAGTGKGYWVGAPSAVYDPNERCFYLFWRERVPKERGFRAVIGRSKTGERFEPVWTVEKAELEAISIERGALVRTEDGSFRLYLSYEDSADSRWKIDVMEGSRPEDLRASRRRRVIEPEEVGAQWTKDPYVIKLGALWYMYVHVRELDGRKNTSLAVSEDGVSFKWLGKIMEGDGWDDYCVRFSTIVHQPPAFYAFYDGATVEGENCEERTGLAQSFDLKNFERVTAAGPLLRSPEGSGSLRYVEALKLSSKIYYWFEYCRQDGSHDLRVSTVPCE